ncbi:MAG: fluoride efflux transporter CrcB [Candidatus Omnitrophota bacterium]
MRNIFIVGIGGFVGAVLRYVLSGAFQKISHYPWFPFGTLAVNLIGCFLIGILGGYADNAGAFSANVRLFLFLGILGAFTTFSTFGYETLALVRDYEIFAALLNVGLHVGVGLFFVWLGYNLVNLL